jgi:hypothetical protein
MIIPDPAGVKLAARLHARGANRASWHIPEGPNESSPAEKKSLDRQKQFSG